MFCINISGLQLLCGFQAFKELTTEYKIQSIQCIKYLNFGVDILLSLPFPVKVGTNNS